MIKPRHIVTWGEQLKLKRCSFRAAKHGKLEEGCAYWLLFKKILLRYDIRAEEYWDVTLEGDCDNCPVLDDCPVCAEE